MHSLQNKIYNKRKEFINKTTNNIADTMYYVNNKSITPDHYDKNENLYQATAQNKSTNLHIDNLHEAKRLIDNLNEKGNKETYHKNLRLNILQANNINNIFLSYKDCHTFDNLINSNFTNSREISRSISKERNEKKKNNTIETTDTHINQSKTSKKKLPIQNPKDFFESNKLKNNISSIPINNKRSIIKNFKINVVKDKMQNLLKFKNGPFDGKIMLNCKQSNNYVKTEAGEKKNSSKSIKPKLESLISSSSKEKLREYLYPFPNLLLALLPLYSVFH